MSESDDNTHESALKSAQSQMYEGRFDDALKTVDGVLSDAPRHIEALYMRAVCLRYLKQFGQAEGALAKLKAAAPEFGRAYQEEGHLRLAEGDKTRALNAFVRAAHFNPALKASWSAQASLFREGGRPKEAERAEAEIKRLDALPQQLVAVSHLMHEGKLARAEQLVRAFLQKTPHHVEAMRLLAELGLRFGVLQDAEFLLESAVEFEPDNIPVRIDYIQVLRKRQKYEKALEQAKALYERDPDNPLYKSHYAIERMQTGDYEGALTLFDQVLEAQPNDPATLTSRGHALKTWGKHDEAVEAYRAAFAARAQHGDAYYGLANLKTYRFTDEEVEAMRRIEAAPDLPHADRINICFSLGKALEDRGEYEESFRFYETGNDLKRLQTRYSPDVMDSELADQREHATRDLFTRQGGQGFKAPDPIFIVGLPRAGSTLIEQILASHSQIDGTMELPNILAMAHRLRGRNRSGDRARYPRILGEMEASQFRELGEAYIEDTRFHREGAPFFTDKMPNNFRHIGLIKLILPNAKIIDARREPMACCFSGFKQLFAEGQEFTYGLEAIGRYYRGYVELMEHWDAVLPGAVLRVQHEDVLDDLEGQVRRMLDYLGLPFEPACVEFHKTERAVRTASSEQVRQPITKAGAEAWRPFEPWLDPLKDALGPALNSYSKPQLTSESV